MLRGCCVGAAWVLRELRELRECCVCVAYAACVLRVVKDNLQVMIVYEIKRIS